MALTSIQREVMTWVVSLGATTASALAYRSSIVASVAHSRLEQLRKHDLLVRERPLVGKPALFRPTGKGLEACGLPGTCTRRSIKPREVAHLAACASVAAVLQRAYPDHRVIGESELRRLESGEEALLASIRLPSKNGGARTHRPDLVLLAVERPGALPVAVEVELTLKASERLRAICLAWERARNIAGVLYFATPAVELPLRRALAAARVSERVVVVSLDAVEAAVANATGAIPRPD